MNFNEREKYFIRKLVKYDFMKDFKIMGRFFNDCIFPENSGICIISVKEKNVSFLCFDINKYEDDDKIRTGLFSIFEVILLLRKLVNNGYVSMMNPGMDNRALYIVGRYISMFQDNDRIIINNGQEYIDIKTFKWYDSNNNEKYKCYETSEKSLPICEYINIFPLISQELIDLVNNDFETEETKHFKKELWISRIALGIAIIGLIASFIIPFFTTMKIDNNQFEKMIEIVSKQSNFILFVP